MRDRLKKNEMEIFLKVEKEYELVLSEKDAQLKNLKVQNENLS